MEWTVVRYHDGREIHKGSKYRMETDDVTAALTVFDVDNNDVGLYRCELYNQHGRVETSGSLTVNGQLLSTHYSIYLYITVFYSVVKVPLDARERGSSTSSFLVQGVPSPQFFKRRRER